MLIPVRSSRFKRDVKRAGKRGKDLGKLRALLASLIEQEPLSARHRDHPLRGILERVPGGTVPSGSPRHLAAVRSGV